MKKTITITIAGRPNVGKSTLAQLIYKHLEACVPGVSFHDSEPLVSQATQLLRMGNLMSDHELEVRIKVVSLNRTAKTKDDPVVPKVASSRKKPSKKEGPATFFLNELHTTHTTKAEAKKARKKKAPEA